MMVGWEWTNVVRSSIMPAALAVCDGISSEYGQTALGSK